MPAPAATHVVVLATQTSQDLQIAFAALLFIATFALAFVTFQFTREAKRQRRIEALNAFFREIGNTRVRKLRARLFQVEHPPLNFDEERRLAVAYDRIGTYVVAGLLEEDIVTGAHGSEYVDVYKALRSTIERVRETGGRRSYCHSFEEAARKFGFVDTAAQSVAPTTESDRAPDDHDR